MKNILTLSTFLLLLFSNAVFGDVNIYPPNLRSPLNEELGQPPDVVLNWDAVTGETLNITYELQLATNPDFSDALVFDKTDLTAVQAENLKFAQTFYWRVRAFDEDTPSEWSETWSFSTAASVRLKTNPGPSIGSMVYANPLISWEKISGLTAYQLQVDTVSVFVAENSGTTTTINATFVNENGDKWAVGDNGLVLHYDSAWITVDAGVTEDLNDLYFLSDNDGYLVGNGGLVVHFDGTTWQTVDAGTTEDLNGIWFVDAGTGWVVGSGGTAVKYSEGSWTVETTGSTNELYDVYALSNTNVWACGKGKTVAHFDGTGWTSEEVGSRDLYTVWFTDENNGWVAGKSGKINYFNGTEWVEQKSGTTKDLYSLSFSGNTGYAVGKSGTMVIYTGEWALMASGFTDNLLGIHSAGDFTLFGGLDGNLASSTDFGFSSPYLKVFEVPFDSGSYQLTNLLFGKVTYYRMRAIHAMDTSAWSGPWSVETYPAPELDKPSNGKQETDLALLFKWDKYEGTTDYVFQIGADENFDVSWSLPLDSNTIDFTTVLFGHEYFWRVNTLHPEDISAWSEVWTFTTTNTVVLNSPEENAEDVNPCPKFEWEKIEGVPKYELAFDADENLTDPNTIIVNTNSNQCQESLENNTVYFWKVRAISGLDSSDWSPVWSFKTEGFIGIDDNLRESAVQVYPNPSNGDFVVTINSLKGERYTLSVTDMAGRVLLEREVNCYPGENEFNIRLTKAEGGIYTVNIGNGNHVVTKKLFIK